VVVAGKGLDHLAGDGDRGAGVAAVEGRLSAARLRGGHVDIAAGAIEEVDRGETDCRAHHVDQAGNEASDSPARSREYVERPRTAGRADGASGPVASAA